MRKKVAFIACSKTKKSTPCRAEIMYQGVLFKKALSYCKKNFDTVYVLSAKYGLISLNAIIEPYEKTLNKMGKYEKVKWSQMVQKQINKKALKGDFYFFTGENYHRYFIGHKPLKGLSLGYQLKWFDDQNRKGELSFE